MVRILSPLLLTAIPLDLDMGGANMIAFTTGRGSCFGAKPSPSIKLATNTPMFKRLEEDMDINCGALLDGEVDMEAMGQRIFEYFLYVASGGKTREQESSSRVTREQESSSRVTREHQYQQ